MKNILKFAQLVLIPILITFASLWYAINFFSWETFGMETETLGSTLTTINSTDKVSTLPTNLNANFTALNNGKVEVSTLNSTTTLPSITTLSNLATIGTITSGTWNATALTVAYGGTGSTTLQQYAVLLGNGTGAVSAVQGLGTSGQFLTSGGAGTPPSWTSASVDENLDYDWTGQHTGIGIVGEIIAYASSSVPIGWLACDGSSVSTTTYARLFNLIGYMYGGSAGNFTLPDLRGRNIIGYGTTTEPVMDAMGETGGATSTVLTIDQMPSHNHTGTFGGNYADPSGGAGSELGRDSAINTSSTGGGAQHPNLDPFIVMQYLIKY